MNDPTWAWNLRNGYLHWSPELEAMHGLPPGTFPGTPAASEAFIHPEDRSRVVDALARGIESRSSTLELQYRILRLDGGVRRVKSRSHLLVDQSRTPALMTGRCFDVALAVSPGRLRNIWLRQRCQELARRSREAFGAMVQRGPEALLLRRGDTILLANDAFGRLAGFEEGSTLAGRSLAELIAPRQRDLLPREAHDGRPARLRLVRRDGTEGDPPGE